MADTQVAVIRHDKTKADRAGPNRLASQPNGPCIGAANVATLVGVGISHSLLCLPLNGALPLPSETIQSIGAPGTATPAPGSLPESIALPGPGGAD